MNESVYQVITDRIIGLLEKNVVPWQRPWASTHLPVQNLVSRHQYRGINVFLLNSLGYASPYFVSFRQAQELGGHVKRGEKGCPVIYWNWVEVQDKETGDKKRIPLLRYYSVFNASAQCEGITVPTITPPVREFTPIQAAQKIVDGMPQKPEIRHGLNQAFYSPVGDFIGMPAPEMFRSGEDYYSTLMHECVHASGAESRLNRKGVSGADGNWSAFGSDPYSREELVAECGAALLCGEAGILDRTVDNSAAYISGWLQRLKGDSKMVVYAAGQAQKAADWILGKLQPEGPQDTDQN